MDVIEESKLPPSEISTSAPMHFSHHHPRTTHPPASSYIYPYGVLSAPTLATSPSRTSHRAFGPINAQLCAHATPVDCGGAILDSWVAVPGLHSRGWTGLMIYPTLLIGAECTQ